MDEQTVIEFLNKFDQVMVELDVKTLDKLMNDNAVLQHITGYLQPKSEWLEQVKVDYFTYRHVKSTNFKFNFKRNKCVVEYDWTIIGNSHWEFKNIVTLNFDGEKIKCHGTNQLCFR